MLIGPVLEFEMNGASVGKYVFSSIKSLNSEYLITIFPLLHPFGVITAIHFTCSSMYEKPCSLVFPNKCNVSKTIGSSSVPTATNCHSLLYCIHFLTSTLVQWCVAQLIVHLQAIYKVNFLFVHFVSFTILPLI